MSASTPVMNAVDRLLDLIDELEKVIADLRREIQEGEHGDRHPTF
jgi:hypothetical protein